MGKIDYNAWQQYSNKQGNGNSTNQMIGFFSLRNDGDSAIVRFVENDPTKYDIGALHALGKENKYKRVSCLRTPYDPLEKCPMCENGQKVMMRMYVKLIQYVVENGEIVEKPCLWERPAGFARQLSSLADEYGDLTNSLFKVVRSGSGLETTYDIMYAPSAKYPNEKYTTNTIDVFDNYSAFNRIVKEYTFSQMQALASGRTLDEIFQQNTPQSDYANEKQSEVATKETKVVETPSQSTFAQSDLPFDAPYQASGVQEQQTTQFEQRQRKPWEVPSGNDQATPRRRY